MNRLDISFNSKGTRCAGWLYLPDAENNPPVVIMAHGIGAEKTFRLPAYAERFAEKGMAVFLFDYRNFGDSSGKPRNLINAKRHVEDWLSAIEHVRTLENIDGNRIALWGTSFSGGHVLVAAAKASGISAVVSQVPFVDGLSTLTWFPFKYTVQAISHGFRDLVRIITFRSPHLIKIVDEPDSFALLNTPDCMPSFNILVPEDSKWENRCPARIVLTIPLYRPRRYARRINCPVLIVYAERDSLISPDAVCKTINNIKDVKVISLETGHFDLYAGEVFEMVAEAEAAFLKNVLCDHNNKAEAFNG